MREQGEIIPTRAQLRAFRRNELRRIRSGHFVPMEDLDILDGRIYSILYRRGIRTAAGWRDIREKHWRIRGVGPKTIDTADQRYRELLADGYSPNEPPIAGRYAGRDLPFNI